VGTEILWYIFLYVLLVGAVYVYCYHHIYIKVEYKRLRQDLEKWESKLEELSKILEKLNDKTQFLDERITILKHDLINMIKLPPNKRGKSGTVNKDVWDKIDKGMSREEVSEILGPPTASFNTPTGEDCRYGASQWAGQIFFINGKVDSYKKPGVDSNMMEFQMDLQRRYYREAPDSIDPPEFYYDNPADDKLERFRRWNGMALGFTKDEVINKLGRPHRVTQGTAGEIWNYGVNQSDGLVIFSGENKVSSYEKPCPRNVENIDN